MSSHWHLFAAEKKHMLLFVMYAIRLLTNMTVLHKLHTDMTIHSVAQYEGESSGTFFIFFQVGLTAQWHRQFVSPHHKLVSRSKLLLCLRRLCRFPPPLELWAVDCCEVRKGSFLFLAHFLFWLPLGSRLSSTHFQKILWTFHP